MSLQQSLTEHYLIPKTCRACFPTLQSHIQAKCLRLAFNFDPWSQNVLFTFLLSCMQTHFPGRHGVFARLGGDLRHEIQRTQGDLVQRRVRFTFMSKHCSTVPREYITSSVITQHVPPVGKLSLMSLISFFCCAQTHGTSGIQGADPIP